ncbi:hypothetical protein EMPG_13013 [Blastomyces silverae]|uniref:Uncharacterized protein n=1 Tax=Blastomyces silverae TaxID=2060906 RepID=A0A0H1BKJ6_9EURO|nr:hypothetical protein EMPG_13013 [Blastomyces silverae]
MPATTTQKSGIRTTPLKAETEKKKWPGSVFSIFFANCVGHSFIRGHPLKPALDRFGQVFQVVHLGPENLSHR